MRMLALRCLGAQNIHPGVRSFVQEGKNACFMYVNIYSIDTELEGSSCSI